MCIRNIDAAYISDRAAWITKRPNGSMIEMRPVVLPLFIGWFLADEDLAETTTEKPELIATCPYRPATVRLSSLVPILS